MRKLAVLLALFLAILPLHAAVSSAYTPLYSRNLALGGTSVTSARYSEVFYSNPALVTSDNQFLSIPSASFTLYNINKLVQPGGALDIFFTQNNSDEDMNRAFNQLINSIGAGNGDVVSFQASAGFISGIAGLSLDTGIDVHSMGEGGESSTLILEGNFALSLAIALPWHIGEHHSLSFGIGAHLVFRGYTIDSLSGDIIPGGFTASSLIDFYQSDDVLASVLNQVPVAFGFAIPFDLGFTYSYSDIFKTGFVIKNLNGIYHMQTYSSANQLYYMLTGGYLGDSVPEAPVQGPSFRYATPVSFDIGFSLSTPAGGIWDWIDITGSLDVTDVYSLFFTDGLSCENFLQRLHFGLELTLMRTFDFRFGINSGYMSFGFCFDFQVFSLDFLYAALEYGEHPGDKPLDFITLCIRIGFEED